MKRGLFLVGLCVALCQVAAQAADTVPVKSFTTNSMATIVQQHEGRAFVLVLWSQSCHYCMQHVGKWRALQQRHPGVPIVMVNCDAPAEQGGVPGLLAEKRLQKISHYAFADEDAMRLRWSIDPQWHGELPRLYLFGHDGRATAVSGVPDWAGLASWMKQQGRRR